MKERLQFLLLYYIFWLTYFVCARTIFLAYHIQDTKHLTLELLYGIYKNGFVMDMSMSAYLSVIPFVLVAGSHFIKKSRLESWLYGYTLFFVFILTLLIIIDFEVYNVWKFRLDETPLNYLSSPKEAFASAKSSPIFQLFLSYLILLAIASYFVYRIISHNLNKWKFIEKIPFIPIVIGVTCLLIIPIRGGLFNKILTPGKLYFSDNYFANISTINSPWYFTYSLLKRFDKSLNPYGYLPRNEIKKNLAELYPKTTGSYNPLIRVNDSTNVLFVVVESLTDKVLGKETNGHYITPFLNSLRDSSVYFSNVYASGSHTEEGIVALLNGYPSTPANSVIYENKKVASLPFLSKDFGKNNYATSFYYGGDASFLNLKQYILTADFQRIIESTSFPDSLQKSIWGVYDEVLFDRFLADNKIKSGKPFFSTLLTVSSHEPFDVPASPKFPDKDSEMKFYNAVNYVDQKIANFIAESRTQWWWENTLIVIIADHGHRFPKSSQRFDDYRIPMFWTGGAVKNYQQNNKVISQTDVPNILLSHFKIDASAYQWSKNSLKPSQPQWAFFTFNNGFGYVEPTGKLLFDNTGQRLLFSDFEDKNFKSLNRAKTLQQSTYNDYINR